MANDRDVLCLIDRLLARMARAIDYEVDPRELEGSSSIAGRARQASARSHWPTTIPETTITDTWDPTVDWKQRVKTRRELEHDATRNGTLEPLSKG